MSRTEYAKAAELARRDARDASRRTFVTGFPLLIGGAAFLSLQWNGRIRWGAVPGGEFNACVMLAQAICLFWFAAVIGFRSLCRRHWIFAFFCLGPVILLANVALICAGAGMTTLHQGDASTWVLITLILVSIPLGLMIDLKHPAPVPRSQPGRSLSRAFLAAAILAVTALVLLSSGAMEIAAGCGVALLTLVWYHAGMWKIRTARQHADGSEPPSDPAPGSISRAAARIITIGAILISTVCSFSSFGERDAGNGGALVVQIFSWYHTGVW